MKKVSLVICFIGKFLSSFKTKFFSNFFRKWNNSKRFLCGNASRQNFRDWKRWWNPHSCKFHNFIRPVCILMTTPYDWNDQLDNEWEMSIRLKQFYNLLWYSFYHSYCIEVHLRAQKKHEVTQTSFKVAYEYFLQQNLPPKQYNNSVVHLYPHPYYNIVEFQGVRHQAIFCRFQCILSLMPCCMVHVT